LVRAGARFDLVTERSGRHFTPRVVIGDGCSFEQNFHLACATEIIFEDHVAVTENVGVFDILHPYEDVTLPIGAQPLRVAPVRIGTGSLLGMGSVVQPGVTIGAHCLIGANAVVTHDIPPFSVAVGAPARVVRRYDHERGAWVAP
jgi:acetyltransferase-like isoleucine patch superfamily enzyme